MKRHCSICARGGSKGVKNKNIREIAGKPLIAHSIEQALAVGLFANISVSSDSPEILAVAQRYSEVTIIRRPSELATDQAAKIPAIRHCLLESEKVRSERFDLVVDMDATSPLRNLDDINTVVAMMENSADCDNVITGAPARRSPYFNLIELDTSGYAHLSKALTTPLARRQDAPACFDMNASIYAWNRSSLLAAQTPFSARTRLHVMPEERSVDIDSELDFMIVEMLLQKRGEA